VCDADSQSLRALRVVLHGAGFEVDATRTAVEALDRGALRLPTAAIIDLVLPDGDGVEVCRRLREWSAMPVILLSAVCNEDVQVRAFEAGADDYVTKPFRPRELVARLRANLRRVEPGGEEPCVELDGLEVDLAARVVRRDGDEVHLTPIEFKLLTVLIRNRGRLLIHNALLQQVWGAAYMDSSQTLRAHIANLRRKIEPANGKCLIHADHGLGYRFVDAHPEGAAPARLAGDVNDRDLARSRVSDLRVA
jgi:two-component system, OmpR family, KDP operon response regulator KdpE